MNRCLSHRKALAKKLREGFILLSGGIPIPRNHDVEYPFRQNSDFLYLTGADEPRCHLLIDPFTRRQTLFIPKVDTHHRVWLGNVPGPSEAAAKFGFSRVLYADALPAELRALKKRSRRCFTDAASARRFRSELRGIKNDQGRLTDALEDLRAAKDPEELKLMRLANRVSEKGHREVMRRTKAGMRENQVQSIFEAECLKAGLTHLGYPSIVAAGKNGAVLHYHRNDALLKKNDLLLIDAGAEAGGYAADITRTFPVSGRFTPRQKDIYSIVLNTQKTCIAESRPGINSASLHVRSMTLIAEGLKSLGLLKGDLSGLVEGGAVRIFYPHGLTHMLGLDVHDVTGGKRRRLPNPEKIPVRFVAVLEPGFVITMEPGIYFIDSLLKNPALRKKYRGSIDFSKAEKYLGFGGIRIEDDILIRRNGPALNLTNVPKEIADVEAACR